MQFQLKVIRSEEKGKSTSKVSEATEEMQFLYDFNSSICQAMAKSMEHLTDFVFVTMANTCQLLSNVPSVVTNLPVGARLQTFWKTWQDLGADPKVVQILREGYILPFQIRPAD